MFDIFLLSRFFFILFIVINIELCSLYCVLCEFNLDFVICGFINLVGCVK